MVDDSVDAIIRAIGGFGLPGAPEHEPTEVPDEVWARLFPRIRAERITGLAVEGLSSGFLRLTDAQADDLLDQHRDAMAWCLSVERKLVELCEAFDDAGVPFAVLKGPSVAHSVYAEPSLRSFADLDLLVGSADYEGTCALLEREGHVRRQPEPRPGFDVRFGRASVHIHPNDRVEVDLHRTPGWGPFGLWIRSEELLDRRDTFALGGRSIPRLDDTGMLVNVAMHASLGAPAPKLVPLRDVLQISAEGEVEWDLLSRWAREWHLAAVLRHAVETASATLAAPVPTEARGVLVAKISRRDVRALRAYTSERRDQGSTEIATLRAIPGVRGKVSYTLALVVPDRRFLASRVGPGGSAHLKRWRVPVSWAKARLSWRRPAANTIGNGRRHT